MVERIRCVSQPIVATDDAGNVVHRFQSQAQAARSGFSQRCISECIRGNRARHRGLRWRLSDRLSFVGVVCVGWWINSNEAT